MKNTIIQLPEEYKDLLTKELYQKVKALEEIPENIENSALLYWAREYVLRVALEIEEDKLPINTEGMPWYKEDEPKFIIYDKLLSAVLLLPEKSRPESAVFQQTIMPLPPTCQALKTTHPQLYADLMACEEGINPPVNHKELYQDRKKAFNNYQKVLDQEYYSLIEQDSEPSRGTEILRELRFLSSCRNPIYIGDA